MARLSSKTRNALPQGAFAEPGKRKYPIPDRSHAQNALARVSEFGSSTEKSKVRAAVARKYPTMGKKGKSRSARPSEALNKRGRYDGKSKGGGEMSHTEFHALDHGVRDHMSGRDGKC